MSTLTQKSKDITPFNWPGPEEYGIVPIDLIVANPHNPRKYFDEEELDSLSDSIRKGGQRETATVRELTEEEKILCPGAHYMITSGERRWRAAKKAGCTTYRIFVKRYQDLAAEGLDGFLLNEGRVGLSDLEKAWEVERLAELHGWKSHEEIGSHVNMHQTDISRLFAIMRCCPEVQERMHPRIKQDDRLTTHVAVFLARFTHEVQKDLMKNMPSEMKTASQQINWCTFHLEGKGVQIPKRKLNPRELRRMLAKMTRNIQQKSDEFNRLEVLDRFFENTSVSEMKTILIELKCALIAYSKVVGRVEELSRGEQKQTMLIPREQMPWPKKDEKRSEKRHEPEEDKPPPVPNRKPPAQLRAAGSAYVARVPARVEPPMPRKLVWAPPRPERLVNVSWEMEPGKFTAERVTLRRYAELWDQKLLMFQKLREEKPSHYPDRNDIQGL